MELNLKPTSELTLEDRQELRELQMPVHGPPETRRDAAMRLVWGGIDDTVCVVRIRVDGLLVSSLYVAEGIILVDEDHTRTGGIWGVVTPLNTADTVSGAPLCSAQLSSFDKKCRLNWDRCSHRKWSCRSTVTSDGRSSLDLCYASNRAERSTTPS